MLQRSWTQFYATLHTSPIEESHLVEIKVPLDMPYATTWSDYEDYEGEIVIDGRHHNYVKRKVANDTLYLLCLPNTHKDELQLAKINYSKKVNDFDASEKNGSAEKSNIHHQIVEDIQEYFFSAIAGQTELPLLTPSDDIIDNYTDYPGKPPQMFS